MKSDKLLKPLTLTFSLVALFFSSLQAQQFEVMGTSFAGIGRGEISWCDYDNDHDLDVFVTGRGNGDLRISSLYRNDEGQFTETSAAFPAVEESMVSWGDFDLDGDQDLLLAGNGEDGDITRICRNDGDVFTEIDYGFPGIQQGTVLWVDVDGDSDLDVFISGSWITEIYINNGQGFDNANQDFGYFSSSAAAFGDYDNDGDLDLIICGDSGAGAVTRLFSNTNGSFSDTGLYLPGVMAGTAEWVDYDRDGDLDLSISGFNDALEGECNLYANENKQFNIVYAGFDGIGLGAADWGDFDNDGDADLVMFGKGNGCGAYVSGIYRNEGNNYFFKISQELMIGTRGTLGWADFDNDGDLDFLMSGLSTADVPFTRLYRNTDGTNQFAANTAPGEPSSLDASTDGGAVMLFWSGSTDNQTPSTGLSYNLRIGFAPGMNDVVPAMADHLTGYRQVSNPGNAGQNFFMEISGLSPGTYYWSVQAIDHTLEGSSFAPEQSFTIIATGSTEIESDVSRIFPNPVTDYLYVDNPGNAIVSKIIISDLSGRIMYEGSSSEPLIRIDVSGFEPGIYLLTSEDKELISRILKIK